MLYVRSALGIRATTPSHLQQSPPANHQCATANRELCANSSTFTNGTNTLSGEAYVVAIIPVRYAIHCNNFIAAADLVQVHFLLIFDSRSISDTYHQRNSCDKQSTSLTTCAVRLTISNLECILESRGHDVCQSTYTYYVLLRHGRELC